MKPAPVLVAPLVALALAARAGADEEAAPAPRTVVVRPTDLATGCERDGTLAAARTARLVLDLRELSGRLLVAEVHPALRTGGRVEAGAVLVRVEAPDLERALRAAREALADAGRADELARAEAAGAEAAERAALEQADAAARDAARAFELFEAYEGPELLAESELGLRRNQAWVEDQREELAQLEDMYEGTQLATATKEIVLERARRELRLAEAGLELARARHTVTTDWTHPDRQRALEEAAGWAAGALARARAEAALAAVRRAAAVETAARALRDATEALARLEADRGRLAVTAPFAGAVEASELRPGAAVTAQQDVAVLHDVTRLVVRFDAPEEDLRLLAPGGAATLRLPAFPEVRLAGRVAAVAEAATGDGEPRFAVEVAVEGSHRLARAGGRCRVTLTGERLPGVLAVPRGAVETSGGRTYCRVWANGAATRVDVQLGAGNALLVHVVRGLTPGDEVVLPEEP